MEFGRQLIIGNGEIGKALYEVLSRDYSIFIRDTDGPEYGDIDVLHIAFPPSSTFVDDVSNYIEMYNPDLVIVYSSTPIGTCEKIGPSIVHSPVEGRHPKLADSIRFGVRWVGSEDLTAIASAVALWSPFVAAIRSLGHSSHTEFLKMRSTAKYGINLVWTDYEASVVKDIGMDFDALKRFDEDYNDLYRGMGMSQFQRYILDPPGGSLGGHCIIPNAEILDSQYPHDMLKMIKAYKPKKRGKK